MSKFPLPITTPRLILRPPALSVKNVKEYINAVTESFDEIKPWLPWARTLPTAEETKGYIETCNTSWQTHGRNNIGLPLWIRRKDNNKFIGNIVMWNIMWKIPKLEFGYWLRTSETNNGFITEAANALTRYCFLQLGAKRIEIKCEIKNKRAQHVPERLGYQLEGIMRNSVRAIANNKLTDVALYSRIDMEDLPKLEVTWG